MPACRTSMTSVTSLRSPLPCHGPRPRRRCHGPRLRARRRGRIHVSWSFERQTFEDFLPPSWKLTYHLPKAFLKMIFREGKACPVFLDEVWVWTLSGRLAISGSLRGGSKERPQSEPPHQAKYPNSGGRLPELLDEIEDHLLQQTVRPPADASGWLKETAQLEIYAEDRFVLVKVAVCANCGTQKIPERTMI